MSSEATELQDALRRIAERTAQGIDVARTQRLSTLLRDREGGPTFRRILSPQERRARALRMRDTIMATLLGTHSTFRNVDRALGWKRGATRGVLFAWDLKRVNVYRIVTLGTHFGVDLGVVVQICLALREIANTQESTT